MNIDLVIPVFIPTVRLTYEEHVTCDAHQAEAGANLDTDCGCGVEYRSRETTEEEKAIEEIEAIQRRIVAYKERLQELGIHNWEKISEED